MSIKIGWIPVIQQTKIRSLLLQQDLNDFLVQELQTYAGGRLGMSDSWRLRSRGYGKCL
jgi:hypothetical protein